MDIVEKLVSEDPAVKGIWCVPKYSNPQGITYSDETVFRFANLKPAAEDFRIYWDNAYCVHHLYEDKQDYLIEILSECKKAGNPDMVYKFSSTSKISFPGSGIAALAASEANLNDIRNMMKMQTIGHDKVNQLRHVRFFKDVHGIVEHMKKHADIMRPKFEAVIDVLERELGGLEISDPSYVRLTTEECLSAMRPYVPEGTIAIAPYGASVHRHLSTPVIVGMVRQVTELLHAPVALMVRSEYAALIDEVKAACPDAQIVALPAKLSVMEVAAIIDLSAAMLSVDTANVHLACGSDIPLFAIYSGHDPEGIVRWGPSPYKQDVVIFHEGTKRIEDITPEVITEPLREFLVKLRKPSQA